MLGESGTTVGDMQSMPLSAWCDDSLIAGFEFFATRQLRTPLRVLRWDGVAHTDRNTPPPQVVEAGWEGFWAIKLKTWKELGGADIPDFEASTVASDIGPVPKNGNYREFLIAVRTAIEDDSSIDERIEKLCEVADQEEWQDFMDRHGGVDSIIGRFFPLFIDTIPTITSETASALFRLNLDTPNKLSAASDETLLAIKGVGPAKLQTMRNYCADIAVNRDVETVDRVVR